MPVPCLCLRTQIHNPSWIPADCKLFIEGKSSVFSVEPRELHLEPGQSAAAHVSVCMDDTRVCGGSALWPGGGHARPATPSAQGHMNPASA